jgi:alkanesulfonate monooxygenase SsuD/methylene tetrahydromethanopterin reductase-like flavin-dependent oxidoreductase (luciferase family)
MNRGSANTPKKIADLATELDKYGYYSVLLTYHSLQSDVLLKSFLASDTSINLKFMVAIRTYAISPEYMSMVCAAYNESFPNKLILNVVSGDLHEEENSVEDIPMFSEYLNTPEKRLKYTNEWMLKFLKISKKWYTPEIIMGGHSETTRNMCNNFNATHLSALNMYTSYLEKENRIVNDKQMVAISILIRDSKEEAENFIENNGGERAKQWTIYGDYQTVRNTICYLKTIGVTDIIISKSEGDKEEYRVHHLIKEMIDEENDN